jgi:hypothetical protein
MERGPRKLEVRLVFITDYNADGSVHTAAASSARAADDFFDQNPVGLIIDPIHGRWTAFCEGQQSDVDFSQSTDRINYRVSFTETDSRLQDVSAPDIPDVATAAQNVTAQQTKYRESTASYMGALAEFRLFESSALIKIDEALSLVSTVTDPITLMRETIAAASGAASSIIGTILGIETAAQLLDQDVTNFVDSTNDLFEGAEVSGGQTTSSQTLLGIVLMHAADYEALLTSTSATPAGSAEAVISTEETVDACLVLDSAIKQSRPPVIQVTITELIDLITFCQRRYPNSDPLARASEIMALNRIPNPAAIPAGTVLLIPSR